MLYAPSADNSLWEYAVRRGWGDEEIRVISEPVLLVSAVRSGKVEIILCSGLNRLAHSSLELVELLREFVSRKITLIIPNQHIDTSKSAPASVSGRARCNRGVQACGGNRRHPCGSERGEESRGQAWTSRDC